MEKAGIPDLEMRLIINLYWHQHASVRWEGEVSRDFKVERGVRQGCIISPLLFNLYSEFMTREAMEGTEGVKIGGKNNNRPKICGRCSVGGRQDRTNSEDDG
jgi:hypothetical protein